MADTGWPTRSAWKGAFESAEAASPWPGPRPLRVADGRDRVLIGREKDVADFLFKVEQAQLVQLTGVSGVGKSSLLGVELIPALKERYLVVSYSSWSVAKSDYFAQHLARELYESVAPDDRERYGLTLDPSFFWQLANHAEGVAIVLDQFEEVLRHDDESGEDARNLLFELLTQTRCKVILSYRSEYADRLRELERLNQRRWEAKAHHLKPIAATDGRAIILSARVPSGLNRSEVISDEAVDLLEALWVAGRVAPARADIAVGPLHLQAALFSLWSAAGGATIGENTVGLLLQRSRIGGIDLANEPASARELVSSWEKNARELDEDDDERRADLLEERDGILARLSAYRDLMNFALVESAERRLGIAEDVSRGLGMDEYAVGGIASRLTSIAPHLSSGTYKLERDIAQLVRPILGRIVARVEDELGADEALASALVDAVVSVGRTEADELLSAPRSAAMSVLRAPVEERSSLGPDVFLRMQARFAPSDDTRIGAGPMMGQSALAVLFEELRLYLWAMAWLNDLNLARVEGGAVVLIHDGFGPALVRWRDAYREAHGAWALRSLSAPVGENHEWGAPNAPVPLYQEELSGVAGAPRFHVNLSLTGNSVLFGVIRHAVFVNCDFRGTLFLKCSFESVSFLNCSLDGAILSDCRFVGGDGTGITRDDSFEGQPIFAIAGAAEAVRDLARYREVEGAGDTLYALSPGQPASHIEPVVDAARDEGLVDWAAPLQGGLVIEGGRVSALTIRTPVFVGHAVLEFARVRGSGIDFADLSTQTGHTTRVRFAQSAVRHVAFSQAPEADSASAPRSASIAVEVDDCSIAQWWFGSDLSGTIGVQGSLVGQLWSESDEVSVSISGTTVVGVPAKAALADAERFAWRDGATDLPASPKSVQEKFQRRVRRMDYRR